MTGQELFLGLNEIDEALLAEALRENRRFSGGRRWAALAACLALAALTAFGVWRWREAEKGPERSAGQWAADYSYRETSGAEASAAIRLPDAAAEDAPKAPDTETESAETPPAALPAALPEPVDFPAIADPPGELAGGEADVTTAPEPVRPAGDQTGESGENGVMAGVLSPNPNGEAISPPVSGETGVTGGVCQPYPGGEPNTLPALVMISSYGDGAAACYAAPQDGTAGYSVPLAGAMEAYGQSVLYRVFVDLFSGTLLLDPGSEEARSEMERLAALGYVVALESVYYHDVLEHTYFTLHCTWDQLQNFPANADYGYMLFLYDERVTNERAS